MELYGESDGTIMSLSTMDCRISRNAASFSLLWQGMDACHVPLNSNYRYSILNRSCIYDFSNRDVTLGTEDSRQVVSLPEFTDFIYALLFKIVD